MQDEMKPSEEALARAAQLNQKGCELFAQNQLEPARLHFLAALSIQPDNYHIMQNIGAVLRNMHHYEAAAVMAKRSVAASGSNPFCLSNLGVSQLSLKRFGQALETLRKVTELLPDSGPSHHNYGLALYMVGNFAEALIEFDLALARGEYNPHLASDRALCLLALGKIKEGLKAYEVRWEVLAKSHIWNLAMPEWFGNGLVPGDSILVHHEQGFGDSIMLSRFLHRLCNLNVKVFLAVPAELIRLFTVSFPRVIVLDMNDPRLGEELVFDYHTPMLSMARHVGFATQEDAEYDPYLLAPDDGDEVLSHLPKRLARVGIVWASGHHGSASVDRRRLAPLTDFLPLLEIPDLAVISLQKGEEAKDIERNGLGGLIFDASHWLSDFGVTASIISDLDVVISVDSAVAHLAGALGIPCIMLSPFSRCWRWWNANAESAHPWYQDMTVFAQHSDGSWKFAVDEAIKEVAKIVQVKRK